MTSRESRLVKLVAAFVVLAALFPLGALAYRFLSLPGAAAALSAFAPTPVFTLVLETPALATATVPPPTAAVVIVPNGWNDTAVPDDNFSIALPPSWQKLPVAAGELEAWLASVRQGNPELADALGQRAQQLSQTGVKFWALDLDAESLKAKFATNLAVTHKTLANPVSFETFVLVNVNQIAQLSTRQGPVDEERTRLNNLTAEKLHYNLLFQPTAGETAVSSITQYLLLNRNEAYVLTFATRLDQMDRYGPIFEQSAATFRLLNP